VRKARGAFAASKTLGLGWTNAKGRTPWSAADAHVGLLLVFVNA